MALWLCISCINNVFIDKLNDQIFHDVGRVRDRRRPPVKNHSSMFRISRVLLHRQRKYQQSSRILVAETSGSLHLANNECAMLQHLYRSSRLRWSLACMNRRRSLVRCRRWRFCGTVCSGSFRIRRYLITISRIVMSTLTLKKKVNRSDIFRKEHSRFDSLLWFLLFIKQVNPIVIIWNST